MTRPEEAEARVRAALDRGRDWAYSAPRSITRSDLRALLSMLDEARGRAEKLSAAISWLDYPFVDNRTGEDELRTRVGFMMKDAEPVRTAMGRKPNTPAQDGEG